MKIYSKITDPSKVVHRWVAEFELVFFQQNTFSTIENWMNLWWWLSIIYAFVYILLVHVGQVWMKKNNRKYELRLPLIVWNTFLSIFSLWGAWRCVPEFIHSLNEHGLRHSLCNPALKQGITGLWLWLFIISKVPETIDTLFIVLRQQKLIFLHWYHHASVLVYCFYSYGVFSPSGRWFTSMNLCIHAIMYGYYALRAARFRLPVFISKSITSLQLIQMLIGFLVNLVALKYKNEGDDCMTPLSNIYVSLVMYASYFVLFAQFFRSSYVQKKRID